MTTPASTRQDQTSLAHEIRRALDRLKRQIADEKHDENAATATIRLALVCFDAKIDRERAEQIRGISSDDKIEAKVRAAYLALPARKLNMLLESDPGAYEDIIGSWGGEADPRECALIIRRAA
jgi:hypothetical protein